ncbi:MAG: biopolymer transporter ExbD [Planctomycetota bacterium]|nr:biopolymer transporter ExbD [Planctomycetota bacterium]
MALANQGGNTLDAAQDSNPDQPAAGARGSSAGDGNKAKKSQPSRAPQSTATYQEETIDNAVQFGSSGHDESEMDMTPMVDVTFLLLIFFMVTAAFSMQKALEVPKPKEDQASTNTVEEEQDEDAVTVEVDEFDSFHVITSDDEAEAPSRHELLMQLRNARTGPGDGTEPPNKLIVKAHEDCTHARVVMALDAGAETGFQQVQLMTITEDE